MFKLQFNTMKLNAIFYLIMSSLTLTFSYGQTHYQLNSVAPTILTSSTFVAQISSLNASGNQTTIIINKNLMLSSSVTINKNITLKFLSGSIITLGNYNLTINGPIEAGVFQIFNCNGKGICNGNPMIYQTYPEWWQNINSNDWTLSIQSAVNFYTKVLFSKSSTYTNTSNDYNSNSYNLDSKIVLSPLVNHILIGNGEGSSNIVSNIDDYLFYCGTTNGYPKNVVFENLTFHCKKGIRLNTENGDPNSLENIQFSNIKINRCYFEHDRGNGSIPKNDIAVNLFEVFNSTISENRFNDFDIAVKLKGCDINAIYNNRIIGFKLYGILDLSRRNLQFGNKTGSQTAIIHNDILTYKGIAEIEGAFIKSNNKHIIIRDNFLENNDSILYPLAYIDCTNINLNDIDVVPYNIDITGNRLSLGAINSYLINEEFISLNLSEIPLGHLIKDIPPSSFCKNSNSKILIRNIVINNGDKPRFINIENVYSFNEWSSFKTSNILQNDANGGLIINPNNISNLALDPDGHKGTFSPQSIKLVKSQFIAIKISQKITNEVNELNSLPKRLKIKLITRNIDTSDPTTYSEGGLVNADFFYKIQPRSDQPFICQGWGNYLCNNTSNINFNNFQTYQIIPNYCFDSTTDYWLILAPLNSNKEIRSIIIEPDYSDCSTCVLNKNESLKSDINNQKFILTKPENKIIEEKSLKETTRTLTVKVDNSIVAFPNPAKSNLTIDIKDGDIIKSIAVFSEIGTFIKDFTNELSNNTIDISALPNATYLVKIVTLTSTTKVILKN